MIIVRILTGTNGILNDDITTHVSVLIGDKHF